MISALKNIKWIIILFLICLTLGILTFFTFINQSFIKLNNINLQLLLIADFILLIIFFVLIVYTTLKIIYDKKRKKIGSRTSIKFITFFSLVTLVPSLLITIFSLTLFNFGLQKYFDKKITSAVNNSYNVALNYVKETRNAIDSDLILMAYDINRKSNLFYDNQKIFKNIIKSQRLLRKFDELYLLDSAGNIVMADLADISKEYNKPPPEAFDLSIGGRPIRMTDIGTNRTMALIKLENFIDTYLYVVKFMDPKVIGYLKDTEQAVSFYYNVENKKTGIKITFALIYLLVVSLLLFFSIIVAINFASRLTKPIINLISASEKISSGNLNAKVPLIDSDQELRKLNENFNLMIDKLKKQQDKLLISERHLAWENVARKLAHEIKNPLTPIQLSIDRIKEKYLNKISHDKKNFGTYLSTINRQIKDIENLVNEFSDFARMPKPIFLKINLKDIIERSVELHRLTQKKIKFNLSNVVKKHFVKGDEEQLNRVYLNLIKNSIESLNEKINKNKDFSPKIDIEIFEDKDYIYNSIEDNGIGFNQADVRKMVTPYYTTKTKGTGLGLAIVNKIINDHNGNINFISTKNGAKVEISIPKEK